MGMSILVFSNKLALFFNQLVNPVGLDSIGWKYYFVFVGWIAVETSIFYFAYPETLGHSLEGIGQIFDRIDEKAAKKAEKGFTDVEHVSNVAISLPEKQ